MIPNWLSGSRSRLPGPADSLAVFILALVWTSFTDPVLGNRFGNWSVSVFSLILGLIPLVVSLFLGFGFISTFRLSKPRFRQMVGGLLLASGMCALVVLGSLLVSRFFPALPVSGKGLRTDVGDPDFFRVFVSIVALPALCEEVLFRGLILSGIDGGARRFRSCVACGLLFGFLHLEPAQIPFTVIVGIGLSWVALESGSIVIPVSMHALHNLALLLLVRTGIASRIGAPFFMAVLFIVATLFIVAGIALVRAKKHPVSPESFPS